MKCLEFEAKIGSVVQLQSGGFPMTLEAIADGQAECAWADKGRVRRDKFPLDALKRSSEGADMILIMEGLNATADEIAEYKKGVGNA